jgi:hypothetical protein
MNDPFAPDNWPGVTHHAPAPDGREEQRAIARIVRSLPLPQHREQPTTGCVACGTAATAPQGPFLPAAEVNPPLRMEVHTLRYGSPDWMQVCAPTLEAWCQKHDHPLKIWTESEIPPAYPNAKFIIRDILVAFLNNPAADRVLWVDADVIVAPTAPEFPTAELGFHIMPDPPSGCIRAWPPWVQKHYGRAVESSHRYRNAGVWACDKTAAAAILEQIDSYPMIEGMMEQNQLNVWLQDAVEQGLVLHDLPPQWNTFPKNGPGWFQHFAGRNKEQKIHQARLQGLIPDTLQRPENLPPPVDYGKGAVVWPWKSHAEEWGELYYSMRSVQEYWSEKDWPLVLLADRKPEWWPGHFIQADRYEDALWLGVQCAENVLWMNDDIHLLAPQSPQDFQTAKSWSGISGEADMTQRMAEKMVSPNRWWRGLGQVLMRLHHLGRTVLNFSSHTPYFYQRDKAIQILSEFGIFHKIPFETAYHNYHATPHQFCDGKAKGLHDLPGKLWINPSAGQVTPEWKAELAAKFGPHPGMKSGGLD